MTLFATVSAGEVQLRPLARSELARIGEVDRTEKIEALYVQRGTELERRAGDWSAPSWDPVGDGQHSVAAQQAALERQVAAGASALGAFAGKRLIGIGLVMPLVRPGVSQLTYLYVSHGYRASGIGSRLSDELERIARTAGDTEMVLSATPSENTVGFYRRRGFEPMAEPLPELLELEPEDVHMHKKL